MVVAKKSEQQFNRFGSIALRVFEVLTFFMLVLSLVNLFVNSGMYRRIVSVNRKQTFLWMVLILAVFLLLLHFVLHFSNLRAFLVKRKYWVLGIGMGCLFLFQLVFASITYTEIGWDCGSVVYASSTTPDQFYFVVYPNNIMLAFLYKVANKLAGLVGIHNIWAVSIGVNILFTDIGIVFGALICKKLFSNRTYYLCVLLMVAVIGLSPYILVPYSDTMTLPFTTGIIWLILLFRKQEALWKKVVLAFLLGGATLTGYYIKPTVVIIWVAYAIWWLLRKKGPVTKTGIIRLACTLGAFLVAVGIVQGVQWIAKDKVLGSYNREDLIYQNEIPMSHFLMMGLYDDLERGLYGAFYGGDVSNTQAVVGKKEKTQYHMEVIKERLSEFGFKGFIKHLYHKYTWVTTDGTFFYGGEGGFHNNFSKTETGIRGALQNFTYCETPFYQQYYGQYLHGLWAVVLLGCSLFALFSIRKKQMDLAFVLQMSIFGIFLFLMLFEARSRYLFLYLPFFIILASQGIVQTEQTICNWLHKLKR